MKSVPLILACIAGLLAVLNLIWPNGTLVSVAVLLLAVAVSVQSHPTP